MTPNEQNLSIDRKENGSIDSLSASKAIYDKFMETQMLHSYLNAKLLNNSSNSSSNNTSSSGNDSNIEATTSISIEQLKEATNALNKKLSQTVKKPNVLNPESQQAVNLPFNVVMSNLAALAGARDMIMFNQTNSSLNNNLTSQTDAHSIFNSKYHLPIMTPPTSINSAASTLANNLVTTNPLNSHYNTSLQTIFQSKNCRLDHSMYQKIDLSNETNLDFIKKKPDEQSSDQFLNKKELYDSQHN